MNDLNINKTRKTMLLSILIVNFNGEMFLEQAIRSVLDQKCKDAELLIVDGASTDGSLGIIKKYADELAWWVSEPDKGQSDAFNKGFAHANGKYLMWLNADDLLLPNSISYICNYLATHPKTQWLTFDTLIIDKDNIIKRVIKGVPFNAYCARYYYDQVDSPTSVFSKDIFERSQKFDLRFDYSMDADMWMQFVNMGIRYVRINRFVYAFRMHPGSKTLGDYNEEKIKDVHIQKEIIYAKNHIRRNLLAKVIAMVIKSVVAKPIAIYKSLRWIGKDISVVR